VPEVRVVSDDGEQLGVMDTREAIRIARERGMDLVEVAANAEPPVCRITDFGKFQYEAKKRRTRRKETGRHHRQGNQVSSRYRRSRL
jgi:translation initiation factor IF-3